MNDIYFKPIDGNSDYAVTIDGYVYHYFRTTGFKEMHPYDVNGSQYVEVDGKARNVGALVLEIFGANRVDKNFRPCHLNSISTDNRIENLVWATPSEIKRLTGVLPSNKKEALDALRRDDNEAFERLKEE